MQTLFLIVNRKKGRLLLLFINMLGNFYIYFSNSLEYVYQSTIKTNLELLREFQMGLS